MTVFWTTAVKRLKGESTVDNQGTAPFSWPRRLLDSGLGYFRGELGQKWLLTLVDQGMVSAANFLATIIIARTCAKEQLGLYLLGLTIIGLLMELQNVLIWSPYTALHHRLGSSARAFYTGSTLVHQWGLAGLAMIVLVGAGLFLSRVWGPPGLGSVVLMLALAGPFITSQEYVRRICFAGLQFKTALRLDAIFALFQASGLLLLAYLGKLSAVHAFGVAGLAGALTSLLWILRTRKSLALSRLEVISDLGCNWSFGKWLLGGNLALFLGCQTYPWILAGWNNTGAVAALAACQGVVALANPFLRGTTNFFAPKAAEAFAQGGAAALRAFVKKCTVAILPVTVLFCTGIIIYGGDLVTLIYGPQYAGFSLVITILSLNLLVGALAFGVDYGIWARGRPDLNFKIELIRLLLTVTIGLGLVQAYGLLGVACGLLAGTIAVAAVHGLVFIKLTSTPVNPKLSG